MPWINLATERWRNKQSARSGIDYQKEKSLLPGLGRTTLLNALLAGERELFHEALLLAKSEFSQLQSLQDRDLLLPEVLPDLLSISVAFHIAGEDQTELWKRIAGKKPPQDKQMKAFHGLTEELSGQRRSERKGKKKKTIFRTPAGLLQAIETTPLESLFHLLMMPDSELWPYHLSSFALPLGFLYFQEQKAQSRDIDIFDYFALGAYPREHRDVVYERDWERIALCDNPAAAKRESCYGIDAIEFSEGKMLYYHYVTMKWQAPLILEKDLNSFYFLDQLEISWKFVKESVKAVQWQRIEQSLKSGDCMHIIVHDGKRAPAIPEHLERAAKHYGLNLSSKDIALT